MKPRCSNQRTHALTITEVLVVIVVLVVLVVVLLPSLAPRAKIDARRAPCINNLKQIALGLKVWEGDHGDKNPMQLSVTNWGARELALNGDVSGVFRTMSNELTWPTLLVCPEDTDRIAAVNFATDFDNSKISYFVGVDATDTLPQMLLSGDDNFAIGGTLIKSGILELSTNAPITWTADRHENRGNIGLADGSVSQMDDKQLVQRLIKTGIATNRLAIP
jgi:prepilin-type processing-associated H-X9-DG protein